MEANRLIALALSGSTDEINDYMATLEKQITTLQDNIRDREAQGKRLDSLTSIMESKELKEQIQTNAINLKVLKENLAQYKNTYLVIKSWNNERPSEI